MEQLTGMPTAGNTCTDLCTDPDWVQEQQHRLLGYEILMRALTADPTPMTPGEMSDKIGLNKGCTYGVLGDVVKRINHG